MLAGRQLQGQVATRVLGDDVHILSNGARPRQPAALLVASKPMVRHALGHCRFWTHADGRTEALLEMHASTSVKQPRTWHGRVSYAPVSLLGSTYASIVSMSAHDHVKGCERPTGKLINATACSAARSHCNKQCTNSCCRGASPRSPSCGRSSRCGCSAATVAPSNA